MIWMKLTRPKRPTRPPSTPEGVIQMTDAERRYKAAFMALLENYRDDISKVTEHQQTFCGYSCPLGKRFTDSCKRIFGEDADPTNEQCAEAIADFYAADWNCGKDY